METCDIDVQDQIVACLYEIVEAHRTEIRSGWRSPFGTLRNARNRPLPTSPTYFESFWIVTIHWFLPMLDLIAFCVFCLIWKYRVVMATPMMRSMKKNRTAEVVRIHVADTSQNHLPTLGESKRTIQQRPTEQPGDHVLLLDNVLLYGLLTDIKNHKDSWPFDRPVNKAEVPDYCNVIQLSNISYISVPHYCEDLVRYLHRK